MQFRGYRVDTVHRTVTSPSGRLVRLEPKAFDLLLYMTQRPAETLSREQLVTDVWGGKFVTDDAVMVAVYALRQAFDDDARSPKFIETIRGKGYRWIATSEEEARVPTAALRGRIVGAAVLVASSFAAILWGVLRPPERMPSIAKTSALVRAHARGTFFSERTTVKDLEEARAEFRKAIAIDNRFAEPHAALAQVCVRLVELGAASNDAEARKEAARAVELAPELALSQAARGSVQFVLDRDGRSAERSYRRAIEIDPSLPGVHRRYSYLLGASGRFGEAMQQAGLATEMEPTSGGAIADLAWTYVLSGQLIEAERLYRDAIRLDPSNVGILYSLGYCLELRDEPAEAMKTYRRAMLLSGVPEKTIAEYDREFERSGLPAVFDMWVDRFKTNNAVPRFMVALLAVRAGRKAEAIELLRQSEQRREPGTLWLSVHPAFASLRHQREFTTLVASSFHTR